MRTLDTIIRSRTNLNPILLLVFAGTAVGAFGRHSDACLRHSDLAAADYLFESGSHTSRPRKLISIKICPLVSADTGTGAFGRRSDVCLRRLVAGERRSDAVLPPHKVPFLRILRYCNHCNLQDFFWCPQVRRPEFSDDVRTPVCHVLAAAERPDGRQVDHADRGGAPRVAPEKVRQGSALQGAHEHGFPSGRH